MGGFFRFIGWPDTRCERCKQTRPDLAVSAYGHPNSGGAGERNLGPHRRLDPVKSGVLVLVARCLSGWRCASYSQPLCRNARYSPRQMTTITTSVSG